MAIASTGSFTATNLRSELGKTGSFTASNLRELHGIASSGSFTSTNLRGKSVMSVSVGSNILKNCTGAPGTRYTQSVTATVSGGTSPYSYSWTKVSGSAGLNISAGSSTATVTLDATMPLQDAVYTATFRCTVNSQVTDDITVTFKMTVLTGNPDA